MRKWILMVILAVFVAPAGWAAEADKDDEDDKNDVSHILESMGYPELQVVPRASERLRMEARSENNSWFVTHWPIELSGLATLYVGLTSNSNLKGDLTNAQKDDAKTISTIATAVGASWIIGGVAIGAQRPYYHGERRLKKYPGKDERSILLRERLAEEALERPARTMRILQTVAVITNLTANGLSIIYADDYGKMVAGVSVILSFLPLMFEDYNIHVYDKHIEYKKKIYAPLKSASVHYDPYSRTLTPVTNLIWTF